MNHVYRTEDESLVEAVYKLKEKRLGQAVEKPVTLTKEQVMQNIDTQNYDTLVGTN